MNKKSVISVMVVAMLLTVSLYFVGGTYARYATEFTGEASLQVAKWDVKIKGQEDDSTKELTLNFKVNENENVVEGKIAPDVTATATAEIDLKGTEVAVDVKLADTLKTAIAGAAEELGIEAEDLAITVDVKLEGDGNTDKVTATTPSEMYKIALPDKTSGFTAGNSVVTITVTAAWTNNDGHNEKDTAAGKTAGTLSVPVNVTVQQHIDED